MDEYSTNQQRTWFFKRNYKDYIKDNLLNIPLWYNSNITVGNKTLFYEIQAWKGDKGTAKDCNLLVFEYLNAQTTSAICV